MPRCFGPSGSHVLGAEDGGDCEGPERSVYQSLLSGHLSEAVALNATVSIMHCSLGRGCRSVAEGHVPRQLQDTSDVRAEGAGVPLCPGVWPRAPRGASQDGAAGCSGVLLRPRVRLLGWKCPSYPGGGPLRATPLCSLPCQRPRPGPGAESPEQAGTRPQPLAVLGLVGARRQPGTGSGPCGPLRGEAAVPQSGACQAVLGPKASQCH